MVSASTSLSYPESPQGNQVDVYHGVEVPDPYRWLEDPQSPESRQWIEAQNQVTFGYLQGLSGRKALYDRLTELWNYERYGTPFKQGDRYFYYKNNGLQNQSVLYTLERLDGEPRILIDPNTLSEDGTIALGGLAISENG
ncbi:S9 family peptidase, partial [filamentous cyanobacterium CCP5]